MISNATKRSILRWIHLIFTIPILGYVYSPFVELPNKPPLFGLSSFLYLSFRDIGCFQAYSSPSLALAVWLGAYYLSGIGAAVLSQVGLFIARKTRLVIRARNSKRSAYRGQLFTAKRRKPL